MVNATLKIELENFSPIEKIKAKKICSFDEGSYATLDELGYVRFHIRLNDNTLQLRELQAQCFELENSLENAKTPEEKDELKQEIRKIEREIRSLAKTHREAPYFVDTEGNPALFLQALQEEFREGKSIRQILRALGQPASNLEFEDTRPIPKDWNWRLKAGLSER